MDRREETINRKDVLDKVENLTIRVAEGFARNDAQGEAINRRLDILNGKVAEHERTINEMRLADGVEKVVLANVKQRQDEKDDDDKKAQFLTRDKIIGALISLLAMGLIALITFYIGSLK